MSQLLFKAIVTEFFLNLGATYFVFTVFKTKLGSPKHVKRILVVGVYSNIGHCGGAPADCR